jgi:hypothetical protein
VSLVDGKTLLSRGSSPPDLPHDDVIDAVTLRSDPREAIRRQLEFESLLISNQRRVNPDRVKAQER